MTVWSVYLVRTDKGLLYTGIATDVERRFKEHSDGGAKDKKEQLVNGGFQLSHLMG